MSKQAKDFKVGDKVVHASRTGTTMAVSAVFEDEVRCEWYSEGDGRFIHQTFAPEVLIKYEDSF